MCTFCPDPYSFDQKCIHKTNLMRDIEIVPKLFRTKIWTPAYSVPNKLHIGVNLVFSIMDGDHMAKTTKVKERLRESLKLLNFTPDSTKERLLLISFSKSISFRIRDTWSPCHGPKSPWIPVLNLFTLLIERSLKSFERNNDFILI